VSSFGTVEIQELWSMLDACAPGYSRKETLHNWRVMWRGRTYPRLLLGKHGKRRNPGVEIGHVRNLVRQLEIPVDCANYHLPQLKMKSPDVVFDDVLVVGDRGDLVCEIASRRVEIHRHAVRDGSQIRARGDRGRLVIGDDAARAFGLS
jgi:hypothetical protein